MRVPSGVRVDNPAYPLLHGLIAYQWVTSGDGDALGMTLVCADLDNHPTYVGNRVKVLMGGAWGQDRLIMAHIAGGILTVDTPFTDAALAPQQILAGIRFVILTNTGGGAGGGGGMPPTAPLWMFGNVSPAQVASPTVIDIPHLAGFQDNTFNDEFYIQVLDADGAAPEGEKRIITDYDGGTGRFTTDAFSADVEAGDIVAIFHTAIEAIDIIARGTLDTSSQTVPADNTRAEGDNHFNGHLLVPTEGVYAGRATRIVDYTGVGGIFTLDPNNPLPGVSGLVDYIVIKSQTEFVPGVDGVNNRTPSDVIGGKADTPIFVPDDVSAVMRYLKGILATGGARAEPSESLIETWQDLLIDPNIWTVTDPATGAAWNPGVNGAFLDILVTPNANEDARLVGDHLWQLHSITPNLNLVIKKTIIEWEMTVGVPANLDNAHAFFGWIPDVGNTRDSDNIIGFCLLADVLCTLTDIGGVETFNTTFGEDLTLVNKFRIEVYEGFVDFFLNEDRIAQHATNIPNVPSYPNFYPQTDGGGACAFALGIVKIWYEMVERY